MSKTGETEIRTAERSPYGFSGTIIFLKNSDAQFLCFLLRWTSSSVNVGNTASQNGQGAGLGVTAVL
jgi:hypothetical protein